MQGHSTNLKNVHNVWIADFLEGVGVTSFSCHLIVVRSIDKKKKNASFV